MNHCLWFIDYNILDPYEACQASGAGVTLDNCNDEQSGSSTPFDFKISFNLNVKTKGHKISLRTWNTDNVSGDSVENFIETNSDQILVSSKEFLQISKEPRFKIVQGQNKPGVSDGLGSNRPKCRQALLYTPIF